MAEVSVTPEGIEVGGMAFAGATVDYEHGTDRILLIFQEALDLASIPDAS